MTILLALCKGFEHMETGVFIDVMGWARHDFGIDVQVKTCGFTREVTSTFGVPIVVDIGIDEVRATEFDALAIPGGFEEFGYFEEARSEPFAELIRAFDRLSKPVASVCVAALALGHSGVLRGRRATTYHLNGSRRIEELREFGADVRREHLVADGNLITSCGPSSAVDVAFRLLETLTSAEETAAVKAAMGY